MAQFFVGSMNPIEGIYIENKKYKRENNHFQRFVPHSHITLRLINFNSISRKIKNQNLNG